MIKGIPVVTETQQGTWIENYKSLKIEEPYNRQAPSRDRPGQIDVIKVQNMQYEERSAEEIEAIKKRIRTEKNEIRV